MMMNILAYFLARWKYAQQHKYLNFTYDNMRIRINTYDIPYLGGRTSIYIPAITIGMVTSNNNQQESRFLGLKHMGISTNNNEHWVDTLSLVTTILELMGPIIKH
jgi:hypothetical protein